MVKKKIEVKGKKVDVKSQFDDPKFEVVVEQVICKHQNQGEGKCFDCGLTIN